MAKEKTALAPRKMAVQSRSVATVEAIFDASIQVLLAGGIERFTTTRVADRAGVSVGTLYQYYPNKQSLLMAVLQRHLERVVAALEAVCVSHRGRALAEAAPALIDAYFEAKLGNADVSRALYAIPSDQGRDLVMTPITQRAQLAVCELLASCRDARFEQLTLVSYLFTTAVIGPVQTLLTAPVSPTLAIQVKDELTRMLLAYLEAARARD